MFNEETIKTYMESSNVDRDTAIKELNEINKDYKQIEREANEQLLYDSISIWSSNQKGSY